MEEEGEAFRLAVVVFRDDRLRVRTRTEQRLTQGLLGRYDFVLQFFVDGERADQSEDERDVGLDGVADVHGVSKSMLREDAASPVIPR